MNRTTVPYALLLAALLGLSQCKKKADPAPADQLPPATQTGANTFGCLLNGQPWTPNGNNGTPNLVVTYDPNYANGSLQIKAYRYSKEMTMSQAITIGGAPVRAVGSYPLRVYLTNTTPAYSVYFFDWNKTAPCNRYDFAPDLRASGNLVVSRLDLNAGIISGTFEFTLAQPSCDSVKVTQGRFDKKL